MNTSFQQACEDVAARFEVPALAVGTWVDGSAAVCTVGCDSGTRFRIASVTKPLTALLAVELLDLDAPTGVWPGDVRLRHLLSHLSGFDCELPERDLSRFGNGDDALAAAVAELGTVRRFVGADDLWSYANTGYWLAGWLAAQRLGMTYEDALGDRVLGPLGLGATSFGEPDLAGTGPEAGDGPYPRARRPSGGLVSNVDDLLRAGRGLLERPPFAQLATVRGRPNGGVYGLGLFGQRVAGVDVWGHPGSYGGFQSSFLLVPDRGAVFVGLTNAFNGGKALYELEDAFFEQTVGATRPATPFVELPSGAVEAFGGTYANSDEAFEVRATPGGIVVKVEGEEVHLRPIGPRLFQVPDGPYVRERIAFPREGLARLGSRLAERVP
ncbi:MAG TPA: serine hydrolase domain-containing protein [Gaiellaceae bacterium]|nr:serine hydrolase domain-containing protein [Gaiellaceae bacterium]